MLRWIQYKFCQLHFFVLAIYQWFSQGIGVSPPSIKLASTIGYMYIAECVQKHIVFIHISKKITVECIVSLSQHDQSAPKATSPKPQSSKNCIKFAYLNRKKSS